jgi:tRNA A37 methylthiotransferase MiaB
VPQLAHTTTVIAVAHIPLQASSNPVLHTLVLKPLADILHVRL